MKKDVTICIGTVGYPTFDKCHSTAKRVAKRDPRVKRVIVIKDMYPTSAWLNKMREVSKTTWTLQIDEDMYMSDDCITELLNLARKSEARGLKVLNASGLLYDLFLKSTIGSIKLWNTSCFKHGEFKNVKGSDRQFAKDVTKFGFSNVEVKKVLGQHDSAPSPEIAYFKYKEYLAKIKRFQGKPAAGAFLKHFKKLCDSHKTLISRYAYEGAIIGYNSALDDSTKNYLKNANSKEIIDVRKKLGIK